jgi:hypothetical protein
VSAASTNNSSRRRRIFLDGAHVKQVHAVVAVSVSLKVAQDPIASAARIPIQMVFETLDRALDWVRSLPGAAKAIEVLEYPTLLLECDLGFLMLNTRGKRDIGEFVDAVHTAVRASRRLADWRDGTGWRFVLHEAALFQQHQLSQFQRCKKGMAFHHRRSIVSSDPKAAIGWKVNPVQVQTSKMLKSAAMISAVCVKQDGQPRALSSHLQAAAPAIERVPAPIAHEVTTASAQRPVLPTAAVEPPSAPVVPPVPDIAVAPVKAGDETAARPEPSIESPLHWTEDDLIPVRRAAPVDPVKTESAQLSMARLGQGLFRNRLQQIEKACRLTGLRAVKHLRASHIKPWRDSNDAERLDGNNGLLLSPHVDHLFDQGYLTFEPGGAVVFSPKLERSVIRLWNLASVQSAGAFNEAQQKYLAYHREHIFKGP